jgi:hypothetical protein
MTKGRISKILINLRDFLKLGKSAVGIPLAIGVAAYETIQKK